MIDSSLKEGLDGRPLGAPRAKQAAVMVIH
jgi:hypothetical protein